MLPCRQRCRRHILESGPLHSMLHSCTGTKCEVGWQAECRYLLDANTVAPALAEINVIQQGQVQPKQPPSVRQVQRKVGVLLWQQPPSQPASVLDVPGESFQTVDPVMVAGNGKAGRPIIAAQRLHSFTHSAHKRLVLTHWPSEQICRSSCSEAYIAPHAGLVIAAMAFCKAWMRPQTQYARERSWQQVARLHCGQVRAASICCLKVANQGCLHVSTEVLQHLRPTCIPCRLCWARCALHNVWRLDTDRQPFCACAQTADPASV